MMMNKVQNLVEQLDGCEKYDKENLLIDIYITLIEGDCILDDTLFVFVELSKLRDMTLADGSESYFETLITDEYHLRLFAGIDDEIRGIFHMGDGGKYEEIDQWMIENEWKYNDLLSKILKGKFCM